MIGAHFCRFFGTCMVKEISFPPSSTNYPPFSPFSPIPRHFPPFPPIFPHFPPFCLSEQEVERVTEVPLAAGNQSPCGTLLHLFWVQSEVMPADALSRLKGTDRTSITRATVDTASKWGTLMSNIRQLTHMGSARV